MARQVLLPGSGSGFAAVRVATTWAPNGATTSTSDKTPLIAGNPTAATGEKATYPPSPNGGEKGADGETAVDMPEEEDEVLVDREGDYEEAE